jgi:hypothetical protein
MSSITGTTHVSRVATGVFLTAIIALVALVSSSDTAYASFDPHASAYIGTPEPRPQCFNDIDDDGDGKVNDGCAASADGKAETGAQCNNDVDDDGEGLINDGCPVVGDTSPGAAAGLTSSFGVDAPDVNFGGTVGFTPNEWNIADGSAMPVGTVVGTLSSVAVLGLINNYCGTVVPVDFTFMNATTGGATFKPKLPGADDPLEFFLDDDDGNGIPNGVDRYPSYLNLLFDPDYDGRGPDGIPDTPDDDNGPKPPLVPKARYTGITYIASAQTTVVLSFVVFEPGTAFEGAEPPIFTDASLGFPSVTVLQDPTAPPDPGAITDFCSPLTSRTVLFGTTQDNPNTAACEGSPCKAGTPFRVNPGDGSYNFINYAVSQRDADGDGIENGLDPCPFNKDPDWNPRLGSLDPDYAGDNDKDGIPNSCDPTPDQRHPIYPIDIDNDAFLNRGDNCPLVKNGENELTVPGVGVQLDTDSDGIGDACDTVGLGPDEADGEQVKLCVVTVLNIGAGGTPASTQVQPCAEAKIVPGETSEPTDGGPTGPTGPTDGGPADGDAVEDETGVAGETTGPAGGAGTGVGSLAPVAGSIPAWAAIASALGGAGLLGTLGTLAARVLRRRR